MFDIGFFELVLISIVGLVVLGPERLPVAIKTVSGWIRTIRGLANNVKHELSEELKLQELQDSIKKAEALNVSDLAPEMQDTINELKESARELEASIKEKGIQNADSERATLEGKMAEFTSEFEEEEEYEMDRLKYDLEESGHRSVDDDDHLEFSDFDGFYNEDEDEFELANAEEDELEDSELNGYVEKDQEESDQEESKQTKNKQAKNKPKNSEQKQGEKNV